MSKPIKKPPITKGGMTIRHVQGSTAATRKIPITLPRISMEKASA